MSNKNIGLNIRRLRCAQSLTQKELAQRANISLVQFRNIEKGASIPRANTLQNIASELDVTVEDLLKSVKELKAVRFRAHKKLRRREQILVEVAKRLEDFNFLESLVQDRVDYILGELSEELQSMELGSDRAIKAAALVRGCFNLAEEEPIYDICGLLERHGIKVIIRPLKSYDFFGLSVHEEDGGPAIVVNTWERIPVERWIFSAAHELGHLVLHRESYISDERDEIDEEEFEANVFASYFLMPEKAFLSEWEESSGMFLVDRVLKIKTIFHVSYKTVLYRLSEHLPRDVNIWLEFQKLFKLRFDRTLMKSDEPMAISQDMFRASMPENKHSAEPESLSKIEFSESRLQRLTRKAIENDLITMSRGANILQMPLIDFRQIVNSWVDRNELTRYS